MNSDELRNSLPDGWPTATISHRMTGAEELARLCTVNLIVETMVQEAKNSLHQHEDPLTMAFILGQARSYLDVMDDRAPAELQDDERWMGTDVLHAQRNIAGDRLDGALTEHGKVLTKTDSEEITWRQYHQVMQRTLRAYLLALSKALAKHVTLMGTNPAGGNGHRQAAIGLNVTIQNLLVAQQQDTTPLVQVRDTYMRYQSSEAVRRAVAAAEESMPTFRELTNVQYHPSLDGDPDALSSAQQLAGNVISKLTNAALHLRGNPYAEPRESVQAFYHAGNLHITRITDKYPKGFPKRQALDIARHIIRQVSAHAQDHAEKWGEGLIEFMEDRIQEANANVHTVPPETIDRMLEAVMNITGHPGSVKAAAHAMLGNPTTVHSHLNRRNDLARVANPDQAEAILDAAQAAGLTEGQLDHLSGFMSGIHTQGAIAEQPAEEQEAIEILELAKAINPSQNRLATLAEALGHWDHDATVMEWVLDNSVLEDDEDEHDDGDDQNPGHHDEDEEEQF